MTRQEDTTPVIGGTTEDLDVDAIEDSDRKKRGTSELVDKINGKAVCGGNNYIVDVRDIIVLYNCGIEVI